MDEIVTKKEDFGTLAVCAVRYSLGRKTYMPHLVIGVIEPHLSEMSDNDLLVMRRDIESANDFGDELIDKPVWLRFLVELNEEIKKRGAK